MRKKIKIKYVDFWKGFDYKKDIIYEYLSKNELYDLEISDEPEYVIFSVFGSEHLKYASAVKIFITGEEQCPDFNICDYAIGLDHLDFGDRYIYIPFFYSLLYRDDYIKAINKHSEMLVKDSFCSFVYSNKNAAPFRQEFYDKISQYKKVDSGGRYLNNVGGPVDDKLEFEKRHKFSIAFENVSHPGYVTEKILQSYAAGTIPIYWGAPDVGSIFNSKSFINVMDYDSVNEVIELVKLIDNDDNLYQKMIHEPAIINDFYYLENIQQYLGRFLDKIFCQNIVKAKRVTNMYNNKNYLKQRTDERWDYEHFDRYRRWYEKVKKIFK